MKKLKIFLFHRKIVCLAACALIIIVLFFISLSLFVNKPANQFIDPGSGIIVIDPGHGGIDGGAVQGGVTEKDINLAIAKKLRSVLEQRGYRIVMTREEDVSLDDQDDSSSSRHQRDLNARVRMINNSNAQLFVSIHVNCNLQRPATDGSIVFYNGKYQQSGQLAYSVQRSLNKMMINSRQRTIHDPQQNGYFLLKNSEIPGIIAETAFLSNTEERELLVDDAFQEQLAGAMADGIDKYLAETGRKNPSDRNNVIGLMPVSADPAESVSKTTGGKLAIIIDDFGSGRAGVKEMMAVKRHMTFAVMPFLDYTHKDATDAHDNGFEVILHLPLEPNYGKMSWLGPNPILSGMEKEKVKEIVEKSFDDVPYAAGANIHMGSKASGNENIAAAILSIIKERDLYFVDSRTTYHPVCRKLAGEMGVVCYERDVFLDGQQPKSFVKKRLAEAGNLALKKGYAVAIGHVGIEGGKVTAEAIEEMLPEFDEKNIQMVFISELENQKD